ncbi:hypothetical protein K488DRAFT_56551 [Vararia minispora EC-137]|uniref:Uncharacterized protein n=1 Tax=Vararia minispora EC-137 TaxID=1314806 RepID=A0ACB8QCH4_9AGAM|nr:hypothetical protein K488DRAFT_56551 [Vararia minispora EC-137]
MHANLPDLRHVALQSPFHDGWIRGPQGQLVMWVPPEYRPYMQLSPCVALLGGARVTLDFEGSAHGTEWTKCYRSLE